MAEVLVKSFSLEPYALNAIEPLDVAGTKMVRRSGALIRCVFDVAGDKECVAIGDLSPLPGFNDESLSECIDVAESELENWIDHALPLIDFEGGLSELWEAFIEASVDYPSLSWTMFQIAASVHACARECSLSSVLGDGAEPPMYFLSQAGGKFKVRDVGDVPLDTVVRYDSNRALDVETAMEIFRRSEEKEILYWEEPLADLSQLAAFREQTGVSIALDESLARDDWRDYPCDVYVIKPTVLGWRRTKEVVCVAKENHARVVVSTAYESVVGREFLRDYARSIGAELGLGRPELFSNDFSDGDRVATR